MKKRTFKRIRALLILCLVFVVSYNVVFAMGGSKYEVESEIYVECGDTLWTIAKDYYGDTVDTRKAIDYQRERIKGQLVEIRVAEKNFEMARIRLNEAVKDRKTHEKLREKAFEEFLVELSQEENKEIDQLVSYRFSADKE